MRRDGKRNAASVNEVLFLIMIIMVIIVKTKKMRLNIDNRFSLWYLETVRMQSDTES